MMSNSPLIKDADSAIARLNEAVEQLGMIRERLEYARNSFGGRETVTNRMDLEAALLLEKMYLQGGRSGLSTQLSSQSSLSVSEGSKIRISIEGEWSSFEFQNTFKSVSQLYELAFVSLKKKEYFRSSPRRELLARKAYQHGELYQYLTYEEELRVKKIQYNSPGDIEFISLVAEHSPSIIRTVLAAFALVRYAPDLCMKLPAIYSNWRREIANAREIRRAGERQELLHDLFQRRLKRMIENEFPLALNEKTENALSQIEGLIHSINENDATDGVRLAEETFKSLSHLAELQTKRKIELPG